MKRVRCARALNYGPICFHFHSDFVEIEMPTLHPSLSHCGGSLSVSQSLKIINHTENKKEIPANQ